MYETHTDGRLIAQLNDAELLSIVANMAARMQQCVDLINNAVPVQNQSVVGLLNPSFSPQAQRKKAESSFKFLDESFSYYVMEAAIRGVAVTEFVQVAYGRKSKMESPYSAINLLED